MMHALQWRVRIIVQLVCMDTAECKAGLLNDLVLFFFCFNH